MTLNVHGLLCNNVNSRESLHPITHPTRLFLPRKMKEIVVMVKGVFTMIFFVWYSFATQARLCLLNLSLTVIPSASKLTYVIVLSKVVGVFFSATVFILHLQNTTRQRLNIWFSIQRNNHISNFYSFALWVTTPVNGIVLKIRFYRGLCVFPNPYVVTQYDIL